MFGLALKVGAPRVSRRRLVQGGLTLGFLAAAPLSRLVEALPGSSASRVIDLGTHVVVDGWVIPRPDDR